MGGLNIEKRTAYCRRKENLLWQTAQDWTVCDKQIFLVQLCKADIKTGSVTGHPRDLFIIFFSDKHWFWHVHNKSNYFLKKKSRLFWSNQSMMQRVQSWPGKIVGSSRLRAESRVPKLYFTIEPNFYYFPRELNCLIHFCFLHFSIFMVFALALSIVL